jgi:addiction module HigA family antidote
MTIRIPTHPGEILREEMQARGVSANRLALALGVPSGRVVEIINGKRGISADAALRLARHFGNSPQFWMNLQVQYDLAVAARDRGSEINARVAALSRARGKATSAKNSRGRCSANRRRQQGTADLVRP